jgi:DNA invertase Pin-like site-specific DNA recombinase
MPAYQPTTRTSICSAKAARPGLALALEVARSGDQLVVWRLDRLGRSMSDPSQATCVRRPASLR